MKDIYTFKHTGYADDGIYYATSEITRVLDDGDDISICAVVDAFADFLRACGFQEVSISKFLNLEE
jgi:hypothetical protein